MRLLGLNAGQRLVPAPKCHKVIALFGGSHVKMLQEFPGHFFLSSWSRSSLFVGGRVLSTKNQSVGSNKIQSVKVGLYAFESLEWNHPDDNDRPQNYPTTRLPITIFRTYPGNFGYSRRARQSPVFGSFMYLLALAI